jgi:hypothetical protein
MNLDAQTGTRRRVGCGHKEKLERMVRKHESEVKVNFYDQ